MSPILIHWLVTTIAILVAAYIIPGIRVDSLGAALIGAAILGILNAVLKPILVILTLPITLLTLGLFPVRRECTGFPFGWKSAIRFSRSIILVCPVGLSGREHCFLHRILDFSVKARPSSRRQFHHAKLI